MHLNIRPSEAAAKGMLHKLSLIRYLSLKEMLIAAEQPKKPTPTKKAAEGSHGSRCCIVS